MVTSVQGAIADTPDEYLTLLASDKKGFVRNLDDWNELLTSENNPLKHVDKESVQIFTNTLKFNGGGLAHANYESLVDQLTHRQFVDFWSYFGISRKLLLDYQDKKCASRGTCSSSYFDTCTSSC